MVQFSNNNAEICVFGRCWFETGIGTITNSYCEMLARSFPLCVFPTEPHLRGKREIKLPNGRVIPVWQGQKLKASIFVDVLWNGAHDINYQGIPPADVRIASVVFDSDQAPTEWAAILNENFDGVICCSPHLKELLVEAGVEIPLAIVPLALDIEGYLKQPDRPVGLPLKIGSLAAFHPRKGTSILVDAFGRAFGNDPDFELHIHSNLAFDDTLTKLQEHIGRLKLSNVRVTTENYTPQEKQAFLESLDVFASFSRGEAFSIGPREALALGKVLALSDVGGHNDLGGVEGVFLSKPKLRLPARYPEIDNRVFGEQRAVTVYDAAQTLQEAVAFARSGARETSVKQRKSLASDCSYTSLTPSYAEIFNARERLFRPNSPKAPLSEVPTEFQIAVAKKLSANGNGFAHKYKTVVPLHDGGFFSIFNTFLSHLVWDSREPRCQQVLPDWQVAHFLAGLEGRKPKSFCYGKVEDGNIWTKLFEPLYGYSEEELNSTDVLYSGADKPLYHFNQVREPLLTYVHAYRLYKSPWFEQFRQQYHRIWKDHIRLSPALQSQINNFCYERVGEAILLGAHVRHPSHSIEQPHSAIVHVDGYIAALLPQIAVLESDGRPWKVFLATDQESVIRRFEAEFGNRVVYFNDVRRTQSKEEENYQSLSGDLKNQEGHQVQHIMASLPENWSTDLAAEVIRDTVMLSKCKSVLHVVSNVSTAVSYINPLCQMVFCEPTIPLSLSLNDIRA